MRHDDPGHDRLSDCETATELISARLDAELDPHEARRLDQHLATCPSCHALDQRFRALDRRLLLRPAERVPDLRPAILSSVRPAVLGRGGWMRPALVWVALVLVVQNSIVLVTGSLGDTDAHLARHLGAFGLALGIGFGYVALRPHRAVGLLPFAVGLSVTMLLSATFDVIGGDADVVTEALHLTELAGLALIWMIAGSPGRPAWRLLRPHRLGRSAAH